MRGVPSPRYSVIPPFVMYCVNGKPRSSLLIESTDSMITCAIIFIINIIKIILITTILFYQIILLYYVRREIYVPVTLLK